MSDPRKALATVDALGNLLRREIAAVEGGSFDQLVGFASEKARIAAELEHQLSENPEAVSKDKLRDLKDLIARDHHHLQLARQATAEMIKEVSQIREKHSIAGIYGRSGAKRDNRATVMTTVDKSF
ncbi:hypothetical protein HTT03_06545 [Sulfitobacter sp. S0837]|uniref:hypothetical protein n=1 Tax=Sulfitobacter maritimus TaxID=2741719 RepID=UPI001581A20B|nr:hypothetical protein [Sulfitobacter maritimus]NUH64956.1 hypothetical protein [Sulfitobacter maritimus]